jgi:Ribonuclease G/E
VRETENRAKGAGAPARRSAERATPGAEERAALRAAAEELESVLGREVAIRTRRGELVAEVRFEDLTEVSELARRVRERGS